MSSIFVICQFRSYHYDVHLLFLYYERPFIRNRNILHFKILFRTASEIKFNTNFLFFKIIILIIQQISGSVAVQLGNTPIYVRALDNGLFTAGAPHDQGNFIWNYLEIFMC